MVEIEGKSIISHQLNQFKNIKNAKVSIIGGYKSKQLKEKYNNVLENVDYRNTNMVSTLFTLPKEFWEDDKEDVIISYGDIVLKKKY